MVECKYASLCLIPPWYSSLFYLYLASHLYIFAQMVMYRPAVLNLMVCLCFSMVTGNLKASVLEETHKDRYVRTSYVFFSHDSTFQPPAQFVEDTTRQPLDTGVIYGTSIPYRSFADSLFVQENPGVGQLCEALRKTLAEADKRYLLENTPTYEDYLIFIDSNPADQYPDQVKRFRFKVFDYNIKKQHKRLMKEAKELSVNLKGSTPRWFILEQGVHPEYERAFCYIKLELTRGKKDFVVVRILALKMGDNWYFVDELSMTVIKKEKDIRR
jgi:hypothetical protein